MAEGKLLKAWGAGCAWQFIFTSRGSHYTGNRGRDDPVRQWRGSGDDLARPVWILITPPGC
jgi:hypothetical protein